MRRPSLAILATPIVILVAGACNTTQPESGGKQTASLHLVARANVYLEDCFEIWQDTDAVPGPDTNTGVVECYQATDVGKATQRLVPWHYSLEITMIPNGQTTEQLIASSVVPGDAIDDFISLTNYDETAPETSGTKPHEGTKYYLNGKRVGQGSRLYITAFKDGFLPPPDLVTPVDPGPSNVLGVSPTFDFQIGTGDTVIVRARKQANADGPSPPFLKLDEPDTDLEIDGILTIGGVAVDVNGSPVSSTDDKAGISFSFTKR